MAIVVTSQPVDSPAGLRFSVGHLDFNGVTYGAGGQAVTPAQFGADAVGLPGRKPDFVLFNAGSATPDDDHDFATIFLYVKSSGKVQIFGEEALSADEGLTEMDAEAANNSADFLAIWVNPATVTTA